MLQRFIHKITSSLTVRIFFTTATILISACLITYGFLAWATPLSFDSISQNNVYDNLEELVTELGNTTLEESEELLVSFMDRYDVEISIMDMDGNHVDIPWLNNQVVSDQGRFLSYSFATASTEWEFTFSDSDEVYQLVILSMVMPVNYTVEAMQRVFPVLIVIIMLISFMGALFYSRYITRPIVRLSAQSQKMTALDFSARSKQTRADEIGVLGRNLDTLSDTLSTALCELQTANEKLQQEMDAQLETARQRTEFFAAVSHELKTPITILSGQLTGMLEGVGVYQDHDRYLPRALAVVRRMEKLVGELLVISRLEQGGHVVKSEVFSLSTLVEQQVETIRELAAMHQQQIHTVIEPNIAVNGQQDFMKKAISNLLSNAVIHSPDGATITVLLEGSKLIVRNTGVQIPQADLPHLFDPLYRVDSSRNSKTGGSGMGLYFVKMVLDMQGHSCMINNTAEGVETVIDFY